MAPTTTATWRDFFAAGATRDGPLQDLWEQSVSNLSELRATGAVPKLTSTLSSKKEAQ
jgi:hypothetical protein